ncbi:MAG: type II toxin-antitoxin system RelE/ParE family toxin [Geobacteraceae bacterium]|nr:type II toxin-antitoxin system RelE/ParE family toxin [Geobacteraceae bacterium]
MIYHSFIMDIFFAPACRKFIKKQPVPFQLVIQDEVDSVRSNPEIGEGKKGDLTGYRVHKFTFRKQLYLMAYRIEEDAILFCLIGTHENFYRDLKNYLE